MALTAIVTNAGRAALVNAANTGTAPVTIAQVGLTATAVVPGVGITALPGEYKRVATISGDVVADDTIHLIVRDESADVFTVRSFALYLADGTLFAIYGQAGVILEKSAQAMMLLAIDVQFADVAAAMLTFGDANFLNPPATTERQGVIELSTLAEAQAGIDALRALTPVVAKAAILGWLLAQDGSGSGLDADLLDGQDGSYYSNIVARLGYTPVNKAGDTVTGPLSFTTSGNAIAMQSVHTGEKQLAFYRAGQSAYFYGNANQIGLFDTQHGSVWAWDYGSYLTIQNGKAWHSGNDGAGSGLDADLLDGQDSSYYSNITARLGYTPVNKAGDTMSGGLTVTNGAGYVQLQPTGDIIATRSGGATGAVYLNAGATRYLYNDGSAYQLAGQQLYIAGSIAWNAGNDGSGSGMDADLLDGQHGSFYADIPGRLGYTPARTGTLASSDLNDATASGMFRFDVAANSPVSYGQLLVIHGAQDTITQIAGDYSTGVLWTRSGNPGNIGGTGGWTAWKALVSSTAPQTYSAADVIAKLLTVDGSGSGLDADLLDGQDSSFFTNIIARLGYTPVNKGGDTMSGALAFTGGGVVLSSVHTSEKHVEFVRAGQTAYLYGSNTGVGLYDTQYGSIWNWGYGGSFFIQNGLAWHSGNDGSGSGLDADLLDGYQASDLAKMADFANNLSAAGYQKLAGGLILQWCTTATQQNVETTTSATFPMQFPNAVLDVQLTTRIDIASIEADTWYQLVGDPTLSGCTVMRARSDADSDRPTYCRVFAIGR